jgi:hypothetical protein
MLHAKRRRTANSRAGSLVWSDRAKPALTGEQAKIERASWAFWHNCGAVSANLRQRGVTERQT